MLCPPNILSYVDRECYGAEVKDWISYHLANNTSHTRVARKLSRYIPTLQDARKYRIHFNPQLRSSRKFDGYSRFVCILRMD
jgi:hypothetical protein